MGKEAGPEDRHGPGDHHADPGLPDRRRRQFLSTWMISRTGNNLAPAFYITGVAIVVLIVTFSLKETAGIPLNQIDEESRPN
ncbi:hypothetical protein [Amycolatopsis panacis]|uniref:hypothetical protein n=1 Tax=Amycolatopsis panacis TaxID=2340917 RepID=UPI0011C3D51B|nr:hypothetical protein [Amycolatopsis panacis]